MTHKLQHQLAVRELVELAAVVAVAAEPLTTN
jgi:hypothetical protein